MGKWLTIFGGKDRTLPAPSGDVTLPAPITAREVKNLVREAKKRSRLVVGFDATASRQTAWEAFAKPLQDQILAALPGELDVCLAVHGGGRLHTFTEFTADPAVLRDAAAGVSCHAGTTRLLDILARVVKLRHVSCLLYVGDVFEESRERALRLAGDLLLNGTRVIILHDTRGYQPGSRFPSETPVVPGDVFREIAEVTGGTVLPFDPSSLDALLQAVAVLAVGDVEALETVAPTMPAATLLLEHLSDRKRIGRGRTGQ